MRSYLESQGAEHAVTIDINGDLGEFKNMVIASGRSVRHIRKMTESIVSAVSAARPASIVDLTVATIGNNRQTDERII